jgi:hypothetical protein
MSHTAKGRRSLHTVKTPSPEWFLPDRRQEDYRVKIRLMLNGWVELPAVRLGSPAFATLELVSARKEVRRKARKLLGISKTQ